MRISQYLDKDCLKIPLQKHKKYEVIEELLDLIAQKYPEVDKKESIQTLMDREKIETTAIGNYVAIPHARMKSIQKVYFAFGIPEKSVDFEALDKKPVNLVFLLLCPEKKVNTQIGLLARLSRILHDKKLRKKLTKCKNSQNVIDVFTEYENKHFS
ncbi:MAG TPA: PTS sugar transporter subunit IIA [Acidobacteriota bacterium]|nr:PTS sugar transporter subunit IIA [Acidobacteriota bacterium]